MCFPSMIVREIEATVCHGDEVVRGPYQWVFERSQPSGLFASESRREHLNDASSAFDMSFLLRAVRVEKDSKLVVRARIFDNLDAMDVDAWKVDWRIDELDF